MSNFNKAQGELTITSIDKIPSDVKEFTEKNEKGFVLAHSESGNHHILAGTTHKVFEQTKNVPAGNRFMYLDLKEDSKIFQDAARPHEMVVLPKGLYKVSSAREYDPFTAQARIVAD